MLAALWSELEAVPEKLQRLMVPWLLQLAIPPAPLARPVMFIVPMREGFLFRQFSR